jgi:hypothetical protein
MQDTVNDPNAAEPGRLPEQSTPETVAPGRRRGWPEGFQPHDPRGVAGAAWYEATSSYDLDGLPEPAVRHLLAEAIEHVRLLLDSSHEADLFENHLDAAGLDDYIDVLRVVKPGQAETLGLALADAIAYRTPEGFCRDCEESPSALCDDHAADLDRTDAYLVLARELGIEVER